ncbi:MAG: methionine gamma-lyase family protein [Eubacteriales bacterium]|nr:methionine gamma-lyase family protein [Eubacteriales bacterium]
MRENIYAAYGVSGAVFEQSEQVLERLASAFQYIEEQAAIKQLRVIRALQKAGFDESALSGSTGYGMDDRGRTALEIAFAEYFRSEAALVRMQFSSGTQVLACCLRGLLRPGDHLLIASGLVYDTLKPTLGPPSGPEESSEDSLAAFGIKHSVVELTSESKLDTPAILAAVRPDTKVVYVQKSMGYSNRKTLYNQEIGDMICELKAKYPKLIVMVDNCYGEMAEVDEPTAYGADICAGSLIKNLGAGIADSGAYVCGKSYLVERVAAQMTAAGVGGEIGPSLGQTRNLVRGFYFAPRVVAEAIKGALHAAALMEHYGFVVSPGPEEVRADIVQRIELDAPEKLIAFCEEIQFASPIDSRFAPVPAPMPGYDCDIIMASGSFVQGSSIELSCDGPLRPPYNAFLQGGLSFVNSRLGVMRAAERLLSEV